MTTPFLSASQLAAARSLFALGQKIRANRDANWVRQLRTAMPFSPMLLDEDTTLQGRIQIVQSMDNESLAYAAALMGMDPDKFPATITLRPATVIDGLISLLQQVTPPQAQPDNMPLPVELETLTSLHLSDTFPLVGMRAIFDGMMSGRVSIDATLKALRQFSLTDRELPGWVAKARASRARVRVPGLGWEVTTISLWEGEVSMEVYIADLLNQSELATICRALLTAYDIQSVSATQTSQRHLVQRVHDFAIMQSQGGSTSLAVLCSHQPGEYPDGPTPSILAQLLMTTAALNRSLGMKFATINVTSSIKVVAYPGAQKKHIRIDKYATAAPESASIRLLLPALAHSAYVRHPAATEFSPYQWVNRLSPIQARWNGAAQVTGIDTSIASARATLSLDALAGVSIASAETVQDPETFEFATSDYIYKAEFIAKLVPAVRTQKRGADDDEEMPVRTRPALTAF